MAKAGSKTRASRSRKLPLEGMRILLTNDDGIHAPGLKVLEKIARELSSDIWVVAPETEQSGASHSLTLKDPMRLRKISARKYAVQGTPTDCVLMAIRHIMVDALPDLVLSGVNRGQNVADDVTYSGTIAAAMEGTVLGLPSIALSQAYGFDGKQNVHWATAQAHAPAIIEKLVGLGWQDGVLMNVNFPDVTPQNVAGIDITRQGKRDQSLVKIEERLDGQHNPYYWTGFQRIRSNPAVGTDLRSIYDGRISITPLHLDLSHGPARKKLAHAFLEE